MDDIWGSLLREAISYYWLIMLGVIPAMIAFLMSRLKEEKAQHDKKHELQDQSLGIIKVINGNKTLDQVPNLWNLEDVVREMLDEGAA